MQDVLALDGGDSIQQFVNVRIVQMTRFFIFILLNWFAKTVLVKPLLTACAIMLPVQVRIINLLTSAGYMVILKPYKSWLSH